MIGGEIGTLRHCMPIGHVAPLAQSNTHVSLVGEQSEVAVPESGAGQTPPSSELHVW
jgi:hypothetical protein